MHTKGPWTVLRDENGLLNVVTNEDEPWYICSAHDGITGHPEEANARLLAAAPDLLEALEAIMSNQIGGAVDQDAPRFQQARSALAKARGAA